jgi:phage FluMu gp28-like protein
MRYFDIRQATGIENAVWQPFQIEVFNYDGMFSTQNKSRQIGASFTVAGDQMCDGFIKGNHTVITVSYNLEESKEKCIYAKKWFESRHPDPSQVPTWAEFNEQGEWIGDQGNRLTEWPTLVKDSAHELVWSNGFRFISFPCRPPRGKRASVVLDEFAHYQGAGPIYTAALPMITRGRGRNIIRILSTPLGASDYFYEIQTNEKAYPDFQRWDHGWWENLDLCDKADLLECRAAFYAGVPADELVRRFGTTMLVMLRANSDSDMFLQEYCLQFLDSSHAFLPLDLILSCHPPYYLSNLDPLDPRADTFIDEVDMDDVEKMIERSYIAFVSRGLGSNEDKGIGDALEMVRRLSDMIDEGLVGRDLIMAYDVGRHRDSAELVIYELYQGKTYQRLLVTMRQVEFDNQKLVMRAVMEDLPVRRAVIDRGGMGEDIAEWAQKRWGQTKVVSVHFTNDLKGDWATDMKIEMEGRRVTIIPDRDQDQQFHSIKKKSTQVGMFQYVVEEQTSTVGGGKKIVHHADKFWANALAISLARELHKKGFGGKAVLTGAQRTTPETNQQVQSKGFNRPVAVTRRRSGRSGERGSGPQGKMGRRG